MTRALCGYNCAVYIESSAPTRIDLAGGTLDIWPLYLFHEGAQTLNAAISLRARCTIHSRAGRGVTIVSDDTIKSKVPLLSRRYSVNSAFTSVW